MEPGASELPTHALSVNIYGRGDAALGDGPSHMGIAVYEIESTTCEMHHIRNPTDEDFVYDPRTQLLEDPVLRGRCMLASLTSEQKDHITNLLSAFGRDASNIPEFGRGNCQDWVAGAVLRLERAGVVTGGEGDFWKGMVSLSASQMQDRCLRTGRNWTSGPQTAFEGEPDARFTDKADVKGPVGKLAANVAFQERMQALSGNAQLGK